MVNMKNSIFLILLCVPLCAQAFIVFDPSNYAQNIVTARNSIVSLLQQATLIQQQVQSLQYQWRNVQQLKAHHFRDISDILQKIDRVTQAGQAISYAMTDIDKRFREKYPDFNQQPGKTDFAAGHARERPVGTRRGNAGAFECFRSRS